MGAATICSHLGPAVCLAMDSLRKAGALKPSEIFGGLVICGIEFSRPGSGCGAHGSFTQLVKFLLLPQRGWRNVPESGGPERNDQARARAGCGIRDGCLVFIPKYRRLDGGSSWFAFRIDAITQIVRDKRCCPNSRCSDFGTAYKTNQTPDVRSLVAISSTMRNTGCGIDQMGQAENPQPILELRTFANRVEIGINRQIGHTA